MGRNVKPRISYEQDALYLQRLIAAVEIDDRASVDWKKEVIASLNDVRFRFLQQASNIAKASAVSAKI